MEIISIIGPPKTGKSKLIMELVDEYCEYAVFSRAPLDYRTLVSKNSEMQLIYKKSQKAIEYITSELNPKYLSQAHRAVLSHLVSSLLIDIEFTKKLNQSYVNLPDSVVVREKCGLDLIISSFSILPFSVAARLAAIFIPYYSKVYNFNNIYYLGRSAYTNGLSSEFDCINSYILWTTQLNLTEVPRGNLELQLNFMNKELSKFKIMKVV